MDHKTIVGAEDDYEPDPTYVDVNNITLQDEFIFDFDEIFDAIKEGGRSFSRYLSVKFDSVVEYFQELEDENAKVMEERRSRKLEN